VELKFTAVIAVVVTLVISTMVNMAMDITTKITTIGSAVDVEGLCPPSNVVTL
jgi:hypothetical protein